jgi:hypothetical protein
MPGFDLYNAIGTFVMMLLAGIGTFLVQRATMQKMNTEARVALEMQQVNAAGLLSKESLAWVQEFKAQLKDVQNELLVSEKALIESQRKINTLELVLADKELELKNAYRIISAQDAHIKALEGKK